MTFFLRHTLVLLLLLASTFSLRAQSADQQRQERISRIENAKIAYLTDKLSLTQEQAQRFWPVYNEFTDKRRKLSKQQRHLRGTSVESLNDQQIKDIIKQTITLRQSEVNLEKEYYEKFQKVLSVRQTGQLLVAEQEFTREILQRLGGGHKGGSPTPPGAAN